MLVNAEWTAEARGSCNVSSIAAAAANKRETTKQKPKHPWKRKNKQMQKGRIVIKTGRWDLGNCTFCTIGWMIYDEQGFAMQGLEGGSGLMGWLSHSLLLFPPSRDAVQSILKKVTNIHGQLRTSA